MRGNETELKVLLLLATPPSFPVKAGNLASLSRPGTSNEANQGHNGATLAQRVRVNGEPNETTPPSFQPPC